MNEKYCFVYLGWWKRKCWVVCVDELMFFRLYGFIIYQKYDFWFDSHFFSFHFCYIIIYENNFKTIQACIRLYGFIHKANIDPNKYCNASRFLYFKISYQCVFCLFFPLRSTVQDDRRKITKNHGSNKFCYEKYSPKD